MKDGSNLGPALESAYSAKEARQHRVGLERAQRHWHIMSGEMRTSVLDVLRVAWQLIRMRDQRRHLRIGQILVNHAGDEVLLFYTENDKLQAKLKGVEPSPLRSET